MPWSNEEAYRLTLLGPWDLRGPDDERVSSVLSQPKRLCLLAYLALAARPVSRATLVALFWPESDEERARNALSQAIFHLRRSLSKTAVESVEGDRLFVSPDLLWCDARHFLARAGTAPTPPEDGWSAADVDIARSVQDGADFFEGWNADDAQSLQEWVDGVRRRVREHASVVLEQSARNDAIPNGAHEDRTGAVTSSSSDAGVRSESGRAHAKPRIHPVLAAVVVCAVILPLAVAVAWSDGGGSGSEAPTSPAVSGPGVATPRAADRPVVAVLMPSVTVATLSSPRLADAVQNEILAALDGVPGIRSIPFSSPDAGGLERFLSGQVPPPDTVTPLGAAPDWLIVVSLRVAGNRIRAITQFRDGSASHRDWYPEGKDYEATTAGEALIELPQEIARDVAGRFEGWIARERPTPR